MPKTSASKRTVSVPAGLVELLTEHLGHRSVRRSGLVYATGSGTPMRRSNFRKVWKRAVERAGWTEGHRLEGLTFHELRHTAAALAIAQGAHPLTIKERLGHSSIRTTMDTYGHLLSAQDEALADALDGLFRCSDAGRMRDGDGTVKRFPRSEAG
ncbi:MAG: tyrosine-type recombinase/integrase [Actinobacteria bacterium]|nr:tyrosine-type recombinase/integrase [Actinomycetota bacterium]